MLFLEVPLLQYRDTSARGPNSSATEPVQSNEQEENEGRDSGENEEEDEEGPSRNISVAEQNFQFKDFIKRFATTRVIQPCTFLLRNFKTNTPKINHCIIRLMHRVAVECCLPALFFQASLFRTFQHILDEYKYSKSRTSNSSSQEEEKDKVLKEMAKFAVFIIRKFTEVAKENPKAFMELLFWKTSRDAYDIEVGYGSYQEKTASAKAVWSEEQEDEIQRLCEEFKLKGVPESKLADEVHQNIIDKDRSKKAVTKKMKELGLISSEPHRKLSKPPKIWAEEEIAQLTSLYQELKDAFDPVGMIVDRLDVKRSKQRVIEKILALGLANDRSELYKKRKPGTGKNKGTKSNRGNREDSADSDQSNSSTSDEDSSSNEDIPKVAASKSKKQNKTSSRSHPYNSNLSSTEVNKVLRDVISQGLTSALEWLMESLEEAAEEEGDESVPLLPISEEAVMAMDNEHFQRALKALGIVEPDGEQEIYWRIPAHCSPCDLRTRAQVIGNMLKNKDYEATEANGSSAGGRDMDAVFSSLMSESSKDVSKEAGKKTGQKRKHRNRSSSSSSEDNLENFLQARRKDISLEVEFEEIQTTSMRQTVPKVDNREHSSPPSMNNSDETSPSKDDTEEISLNLNHKKKKRLIIIRDDSSDDEEITENFPVIQESYEDTDRKMPTECESSGSENGTKAESNSSIHRSQTRHRHVKRLISDDEED